MAWLALKRKLCSVKGLEQVMYTDHSLNTNCHWEEPPAKPVLLSPIKPIVEAMNQTTWGGGRQGRIYRIIRWPRLNP